MKNVNNEIKIMNMMWNLIDQQEDLAAERILNWLCAKVRDRRMARWQAEKTAAAAQFSGGLVGIGPASEISNMAEFNHRGVMKD